MGGHSEKGKERAGSEYNAGQAATEKALDDIYLEDLLLGGAWTTRARTLTEADLTAYAGAAAEFGPLHADAVAAAAGPFGRPVAPAALVAGIAIGLGSLDVPLPAAPLVGMTWRLTRPVTPGTTVRAHWRLRRVRDTEDPQRGLVAWNVRLVDSHDALLAEGELVALVRRRAAAAPERVAGSRRRGRRPAAEAAPTPLPPPEANLPPSGDVIPEPAPEDVPPQPTRRRRRRGGGGGASAADGTAAAEGASEGAPSAPSTPSTQSPQSAPGEPAATGERTGRRRRRRRSNGHSGGTSQAVGDTPAGEAAGRSSEGSLPARGSHGLSSPAHGGATAGTPAPVIIAPKEPSAVEKVLSRLTGRRQTR